MFLKCQILLRGRRGFEKPPRSGCSVGRRGGQGRQRCCWLGNTRVTAAGRQPSVPHKRAECGFKEWTASPPFFREDNVTGNTSMDRQWGRWEGCQRRRAGRAAPTGWVQAPGHPAEPEPVCAPGARAELGISHLPLLRVLRSEGNDGWNCPCVPTCLSGTEGHTHLRGDAASWGLSPPEHPQLHSALVWSRHRLEGRAGVGSVNP